MLRVFLVFAVSPLLAAELGHYTPGVGMVRDWGVPRDKGFYYLQYNVFYRASELKDFQGNTELSDLNVGVYATDHFFLWQTGKKFLGATYGAIVRPTIAKTQVAALLNAQGRDGTPPEPGDFSKTQWGWGDLLVRPLVLGWHKNRWEAAAQYGFIAPVGRYRPGSPTNVGLGMWSHQFIGSGFYYPDESRKTAFMLTGVFEVNTSQRGLDDIPGENFALEYGVSHFVTPRWEIGAGGFYLAQVGNDRGKDAVNPTRHNRINGAGPQVTFVVVPDKFTIAARMAWDYGVRGRFQGSVANISLLYVF